MLFPLVDGKLELSFGLFYVEEKIVIFRNIDSCISDAYTKNR